MIRVSHTRGSRVSENNVDNREIGFGDLSEYFQGDLQTCNIGQQCCDISRLE